MKRLLTALSITLLTVWMSGCNSGGPTVHKEPKIDKNLPTPTGVKLIRDVTAIGFEWDAIKDPNVEGFVLYRSEGAGKLLRVGAAESRYATHFLDRELKPAQEYQYRIATYNKEGFQSVATESINTKTLNGPEPLSFITKVDNLPRMTKLIFRPHPDPTVTGYLIERRTPTDKAWKEIETLEGRLNAEFLDQDLEDNKVYEYRVTAVRYDGLKSRPSELLSATTKQLPMPIQNIGATNNLPKMIKITWQQQASEHELVYYIYASSHQDGAYDKIGEMKGRGEYTHRIENDGEAWFYKVTAIDKDGLESMMQEIPAQGVTKPKPLTPSILKAEVKKGQPSIQWASNDKNVVEFIITRTTNKGFFSKDTKEIARTKAKSYTDDTAGFQPNVEYIYNIIAVDGDGIRSVPSDDIPLKYELQEGLAK